MDPREIKGKASLVKDMQDLAAVLDSTGVCLRMLFSGMATLEVFAMLEMAVAAGLTDKELLQVGERVFNLERLFNIRAGFDARDDTLPRRMLEEPMSGGKAEGRVNCLAEMLSEYYQLRGWDAEGRPTAEKLAGLGLAGETATV
jgi:aldehyde:ferredoxin oxidoreductase